jgi:hypothetical protein
VSPGQGTLALHQEGGTAGFTDVQVQEEGAGVGVGVGGAGAWPQFASQMVFETPPALSSHLFDSHLYVVRVGAGVWPQFASQMTFETPWSFSHG